MRVELLLAFAATAGAAPPCATCHRAIADRWARSAMARSFAAPEGDEPRHPVTVRNPAAGRYYEVFRQGGELRQSEYQLNPDGSTLFRVTHRAAFRVGSGKTGETYIVRRGDDLFQAPLSFYSRTQSWALSPGYERDDRGFNRPILPVCISCHAGVGARGIGCEDCHGDAKDHAVNPAKLAPRLADDICMRCHQDGDARIPQPGRHDNDFRPGTALAGTVAIFKIPGGDTAELLDHHFAMGQSRCFTASAGKLRCITCHDPHAARTEYRAKCLGCHAETACTLPVSRRGPADDCARCHMPKRELRQISHAALTEHRVVRRPGQPAPTVSPNLPDLIYVNGSPRDLPRVTLLQAYAQLLEREPRYQAHYLRTLEEARQSDPEHPFVLAALGRKALRDSDPRAIEYLTRAVADPVSAVPYQDLAEALSRAGRGAEAVRALHEGLARFPYDPVLLKRLVSGCIALGRYSAARESLVHYLDLFPEDNFMRAMLGKFDRASGKP